jgi:hypothetical protein
MSILIGIMCLIFLCSSVLILSSFPISLYQKRLPLKKKLDKKINDYNSLLFDVYEENTYSKKQAQKIT